MYYRQASELGHELAEMQLKLLLENEELIALMNGSGNDVEFMEMEEDFSMGSGNIGSDSDDD